MKNKECKSIIYSDGDYTTCSKCENLCDDVKKCTICSKVKGVAYEKTWDAFLCEDCYAAEVTKINEKLGYYR